MLIGFETCFKLDFYKNVKNSGIKNNLCRTGAMFFEDIFLERRLHEFIAQTLPVIHL